MGIVAASASVEPATASEATRVDGDDDTLLGQAPRGPSGSTMAITRSPTREVGRR